MIKFTNEQLKKAKRIAEHSQKLINEGASPEDVTSFWSKEDDTLIVNPFTDATGRFSFTIDEAIQKYGDNFNRYVKRVNALSEESPYDVFSLEEHVEVVNCHLCSLKCPTGCEKLGHLCDGNPYKTPCSNAVIYDDIKQEIVERD